MCEDNVRLFKRFGVPGFLLALVVSLAVTLHAGPVRNPSHPRARLPQQRISNGAGNRDKNEHINGNFAGAVFIQHCNRWLFKNVIATNYNGDGFSFQVCDDVQFRDCKAINNSDLGFHPGSGSQRPVFRNCAAHGNSQGIFFCWSVSDGLVENCILLENTRYGVSIGHRDTDNIIRRCRIERNGEVGILFRNEDNEFRCGHRNQIEDCVVRDTFENCPVHIQDLRPKND